MLAVAFSALFSAGGCMIPTRVAEVDPEIMKQSTPVAIQAGIDKMDDPETKRRIAQMMASPEMRAVERELIAGLVDSTLATLSEEERAERIGALTTRAMAGIVRGASRELSGAMDEAMGPERRNQLSQAVGTIVAASVRSAVEGLRDAELGKTLSTAMTDEIGPAVQKALRENIGPGLAEALKDEEFTRSLGATARVLGREMVLGATEGLAQTQQPKQDGSPSVLTRITDFARQGAKFAGSAAWLFGLIIVALFVWIMKLLAQAKRYREESDRRAATARLLTEASKVSEGKPWSNEFISALQERIRAEEEALAELKQERRSRIRKQSPPPPADAAGRPRPSLA